MNPQTEWRIGCIVLAAGSSRRFGADKRRATLPGGRTLLDHTLSSIPGSFHDRILVLHPGDEALARDYAGQWQIVIAEKASLGMGHSLAATIELTRQWDGAVIALADMPWVRPGTYRLVQEAVRPDKLVLPYYRDQRGNPVGIGSHFFPLLAGLEGDSGARGLFQQHPESVVRLALQDVGIVKDVDTPDALSPENDISGEPQKVDGTRA